MCGFEFEVLLAGFVVTSLRGSFISFFLPVCCVPLRFGSGGLGKSYEILDALKSAETPDATSGRCFFLCVFFCCC